MSEFEKVADDLLADVAALLRMKLRAWVKFSHLSAALISMSPWRDVAMVSEHVWA